MATRFISFFHGWRERGGGGEWDENCYFHLTHILARLAYVCVCVPRWLAHQSFMLRWRRCDRIVAVILNVAEQRVREKLRLTVRTRLSTCASAHSLAHQTISEQHKGLLMECELHLRLRSRSYRWDGCECWCEPGISWLNSFSNLPPRRIRAMKYLH